MLMTRSSEKIHQLLAVLKFELTILCLTFRFMPRLILSLIHEMTPAITGSPRSCTDWAKGKNVYKTAIRYYSSSEWDGSGLALARLTYHAWPARGVSWMINIAPPLITSGIRIDSTVQNGSSFLLTYP